LLFSSDIFSELSGVFILRGEEQLTGQKHLSPIQGERSTTACISFQPTETCA